MKSLYEIKTFILNHNKSYTFDRQTIKYMGNALPNEDIKFADKNYQRNLIFDIVIENEIIMEVLSNDNINIENKWYTASTLNGKSCWIIPLQKNSRYEKATIINMCYYGGEVLAHVRLTTTNHLSYVKKKVLPLFFFL